MLLLAAAYLLARLCCAAGSLVRSLMPSEPKMRNKNALPKLKRTRVVYFNHHYWHSLQRRHTSVAAGSEPTIRGAIARLRQGSTSPALRQAAEGRAKASRRSLLPVLEKPNMHHNAAKTTWSTWNASGSRVRLEGPTQTDVATETQGEGLSINIP